MFTVGIYKCLALYSQLHHDRNEPLKTSVLSIIHMQRLVRISFRSTKTNLPQPIRGNIFTARGIIAKNIDSAHLSIQYIPFGTSTRIPFIFCLRYTTPNFTTAISIIVLSTIVPVHLVEWSSLRLCFCAFRRNLFTPVFNNVVSFLP